MISDDSNLHYTQASGSNSMDDVDTRIKHLTDLYELWSTGLDVLERYDKHSAEYETRKKDLEVALRMLRFIIERNYSENYYRNSVDFIGDDPSKIKD